ncbi:MCE family protein [Nocardioides zeae]
MRRGLAARAVGAALGVALGVGALTGCGILDDGIYDAPLPGGADVGDDPVTLTVEFTDVLDLVPQSAVKVDEVAVGRVTAVRLADDGLGAEVDLLVNGDVPLPVGTTARLQQTSLLGEKYVALERPGAGAGSGSSARLVSGDRIERADTDEAAQVEQVLGALSMVLNGGGIAQFQEISTELQAISGDDPERVRTFIQQLGGFVTQLDARKESITAAIDSLAALSTTLEADEERITTALDGLHPGLAALEEQRPQLVAMLEALDSLSDVAVDTLDAAQDDIVADLQTLAPVLEQLAAAGQDLPDALGLLLTYPFPDAVTGAIRGDYLNVFVTTAFASVPEDCTGMGCAWLQPSVEPPTSGGAAARPFLLPPTSSATPGLPSPSVSAPTTGATGAPPSTATSGPTSGATSGPTSGATSGPTSGPTGTPTGPSTTGPTGVPTSPDPTDGPEPTTAPTTPRSEP